MPRPAKGARLGGGPAHERLLLGQLASQLFEHRSIQTTEAKARRLRPVAERLVTFAKRGDLHARRRVMRTIGSKTVVHELFTEIAPLVADRQGGYTRIVKTGYRKGDNAPMAVIELVLEPVTPKRRITKATPSPVSGTAAVPSAVSAAPVASDDDTEVPVESTDTVEESAPVAPATETVAAEEVEADAAATADDAPEVEAPASDEPTTPDEKPATPAS